jgi:hypothetical protein
MKAFRILALGLALGALGALACSTTKVQNFSGTVPGGLTHDQVRDTITSAAESRHWTVKPLDDSTLLATLVVRNKHSATVEIPYDTVRYALNYKDSTNLDYEDGEIHENYNGWVEKLDRTIQKELHRAAGGKR